LAGGPAFHFKGPDCVFRIFAISGERVFSALLQFGHILQCRFRISSFPQFFALISTRAEHMYARRQLFLVCCVNSNPCQTSGCFTRLGTAEEPTQSFALCTLSIGYAVLLVAAEAEAETSHEIRKNH